MVAVPAAETAWRARSLPVPAFIYHPGTRAPVTDDIETTVGSNQNRAETTSLDHEATDRKPTRRRVLGSCTTVAAAGLGITRLAGTSRGEPSSPKPRTDLSSGQRQRTTQFADDLHSTGSLTGRYDGTIDRIVDGEHVVVLIESGGKTVGQEVLDRDQLPEAQEGDSVSVWLFRGIVLGVWVT